ncbi:hypothetical protein BJ508DRAFT_312914 [Ascobolus immersus RN42]|uniref:Uncharacterized protein n=1 Tax=Ascobolus immersus RN42 TaxID=1160509 RepID=A0A3N4HKM6_ASCIM|nr:hypothetical protein BJ508DRAFT_312914 [Ascobolus immersus RN42]
MVDTTRFASSPAIAAVFTLLFLMGAVNGAAIPKPCHHNQPSLSPTVFPPWLLSLTDSSNLNKVLRRRGLNNSQKTAIIAVVCSVVGIMVLVAGIFYAKKVVHERQERMFRQRDEDARRIKEQMKARKASRVSEASDGTVVEGKVVQPVETV